MQLPWYGSRMSVELGSSGQLIWNAFDGENLEPHSRALVLELARCADTCDRLDGLAAGRRDDWITLAFDDMGEIHLHIDKVLELRLKHQTTLRTLYAEVRAAHIVLASKAGSKSEDEEPEDMLAALRREKERRERQSG